MKTSHAYDHFREHVQPALRSKLEEFFLLGYGHVKEKELWDFLVRKKWRKTDENKRISELVEDILSIKVGEYFHFATIEAFKGAEFAFDDEDELRELLK
ncbi:post-transcriptional regulator [Cytobacillus sp. FJAT-53684]|uniref:Post-transcriptional regulator n=1 Tax=Cytobacillus mangrovibacter TaxID=3299024 RepID=A0ABW6K0I6_9BACI